MSSHSSLIFDDAEPDAASQADVLDLLVHLLANTVERLEGTEGTGTLESDISVLNV